MYIKFNMMNYKYTLKNIAKIGLGSGFIFGFTLGLVPNDIHIYQ